MIRNALILALILAAAGLYTWHEEASLRAAQTPPPAVPETATQAAVMTDPAAAPDFTFQSLDGRTHSLSDFGDKTVILNFWASWCAPCIIEFPQMLKLAKANEDKTVFLFLSQDEETADITRFLAKFPAAKRAKNIHIAQDTDKRIAQKLFGTYKLPETYLIAPGMVIKEKIIGLKEPWDSPAMQEKIERLAR